MRLADFILQNIEPILVEWETFARSVWPREAGLHADPAEVRNHAASLLRSIVTDMNSAQTEEQREDKGKGGFARPGAGSEGVETASERHAIARVESGFSLLALVAEYRALRASVLRLRVCSNPDLDSRDLDDQTRFNEALDQSLAAAVRTYEEHVERARQIFLGILGHDLRNPLNYIKLSAQVLARCATLVK